MKRHPQDTFRQVEKQKADSRCLRHTNGRAVPRHDIRLQFPFHDKNVSLPDIDNIVDVR